MRLRAVTPGVLEAARADGEGARRSAPIFFVGFPRSGTTLAEQMLEAPPRLATSNETPLVESLVENWDRLVGPDARPYPEGLADLGGTALARLRRSYAKLAAAWVAPGDRRLVDKLPLNIQHLGLIRRLFPNAPVLVGLRDPRDVVLSCYMQNFELNPAMAHFLEIERAAAFYADVMGLWLDWRERLDPPAHEFRYEDMIADPESTVRRVIAYIGEEWDAAVLDYAEAAGQRYVSTPSFRDVVAPIYTRARGRWLRYREQMAPVLPVLAPFVSAFGYAAGEDTRKDGLEG